MSRQRRLVVVMGTVIAVLVGCSAPAASPTDLVPGVSQAAASPTAGSTPTLVPSPTSGHVNITFQITLSGSVPADATFALQTDIVPYQGPGSGGANYLCSGSPDYGRSPCESGKSYAWTLEYVSGTQVHYRFWRELDPNGATEEIKEGQFTVGQQDAVISVTYDFPP